MTTEQATKCTAIVSQPYLGEEIAVNHVCGAEARWETADEEPRCDWHAEGHCRRIGVVEGEEA